MAVRSAPTPNPNAMKFTVGSSVGGPSTFVAGSEPDVPWAAALLGLDGVASVFATADFVTVTKSPDADWTSLGPQAISILEEAFPA